VTAGLQNASKYRTATTESRQAMLAGKNMTDVMDVMGADVMSADFSV
jgi:hypothetical protein